MLKLRAQVAQRDFDVDLEIPGFALGSDSGAASSAERSRIQHVAIMGPNGSGKSTIIELLAGTLAPDSGQIQMNDKTLVDLDHHGKGTFTPPHERTTGLLAQDPLLFPHLSVLDNVAFAPRSAGKNTDQARTTAHQYLDLVGCTQFAGRKPRELSGGQAQRVAIARTLAADPQLILLDEPMAALDFDSVPEVLTLFKDLLANRLSVMVTHDLLDAATFADYLIIMDRGRVAESGPIEQVLANPQTPFGSRLANYTNLHRLMDEHDPNS